MAKDDFWTNDTPASPASDGGDFWLSDRPAAQVDLPDGVEPSTAGAGRGSSPASAYNPPAQAAPAPRARQSWEDDADQLMADTAAPAAKKTSVLEGIPLQPEKPWSFREASENRRRLDDTPIPQGRSYADSVPEGTDIGMDIAETVQNPAARGLVAGVTGLGKVLPGAVRAAADFVGADGVADFAGRAARTGDQITTPLQPKGGNEKLVFDIANSITQTAPTMMAGLVGGPAMKVLFAQSAAQEYTDGRSSGLNGVEAASRAGVMAGAEVLGERFGFAEQMKIFKGLAAKIPADELAPVFARQIMKEIPGEQLTTLIQFLGDKAGPGALNPEATLTDYLSQAGETLKVTIGQTAVMGGGPTVVSKVREGLAKPIDRSPQIKALRDRGDETAAALVEQRQQKEQAAYTTERETQAVAQINPELAQRYRDVRMAGAKTGDAVVQTAARWNFEQAAQLAGLSQKAQEAISAKLAEVPPEKAAEFVQKAMTGLVNNGMAKPFEGMDTLAMSIEEQRDAMLDSVLSVMDDIETMEADQDAAQQETGAAQAGQATDPGAAAPATAGDPVVSGEGQPGGVGALSPPDEFVDLFDEQGRPKFPSAKSVRDFKSRTGLGQDGVRAIQTAIDEGRSITVEEAKKSDIAARDRRAEMIEKNKVESEAESMEAKKNAAKPVEERTVVGEYEIPGIEGSNSRVRVFRQGGKVEAVGLDEGTANNDLSRLVNSGKSVEEALATIYGDHAQDAEPDASKVSRKPLGSLPKLSGVDPLSDTNDIQVTPEMDTVHQAATSPLNDRPEPTQAQKDAGNYKVGKIRMSGMDISIENPQGSTRRGVDADGKEWATPLRDHYGYFKGTTAADGDKLDVFIKPGTPQDFSGTAYVVDQIDPKTGKFDEHKIVFGAADQAEAEAIYRRNYSADWQGFGAITPLPMPAFKAWASSNATRKPLGSLPAQTANVQDPQAPAAGTKAQAAPVEAPANGGSDAAAASGVPAKAGAGDAQANGVREIVEIKDRYGRINRVYKDDLDGTKDRISTIRKNGDVIIGEEIPRSIIPKASKPVNDKTKGFRVAATKKNPFWAFLGKHGMSLDLAKEFAPGKTERQKAIVSGYGPIFKRVGLGLDMLAEQAKAEGFIATEDVAELHDLISRAFSGERIIPQYAEGAADTEMQARQQAMEDAAKADYEDFLAVQKDDPDADIPWDSDELTQAGYDGLTADEQKQLSALLQSAEAEGIDTKEIQEEAEAYFFGKKDNEYKQRIEANIEAARNSRAPADSGTGADATGSEAERSGAGRGGETVGQEGVRSAKLEDRADGTLSVTGDSAALKERLTAAGIPAKSIVKSARGVVVGKTQAKKAREVLERKAIDSESAGNMKAGDVVVDGKGVEYIALRARFDFIEVAPIVNGKANVSADTTFYFHLRPDTASAYENRRNDPVYATGRNLYAEGKQNDPVLTAPTKADIEAKQDRAEQADKLDQREQVKRESEQGDKSFMTGFDGDGRQDTTGPLFSRSPKSKDQTETEAFKKWFGDSKVVDAQGKPLVVYHGTRREFTTFDYSKIGEQGRAEGAGFYFTNSKDVASGYGAPMEVFLSIKKPLAYDAKPFNSATLQKIVSRVAELEAQDEGGEIADGFLANFGDVRSEGLKRVIKTAADMIAADETALDQLSGIVGSGVRPQFVNQATRDVTGFDGVVANGFSNAGDSDNRIYVAFFPEQIKSATGNNGDFDPANADIRFSRSASAPVFYSALSQEVGKSPMNAGNASAWNQYLDALAKRGAIKADEVEWTGLREWLNLQEGKVSKEQVMEYLDANGVQVTETVLGGSDPKVITSDQALERLRNGMAVGWRHGDQVVQMYDPDSVVHDNSYYREMVDAGQAQWIDTGTNVGGEVTNTKYGNYTLPGGENYREVLLTLPGNQKPLTYPEALTELPDGYDLVKDGSMWLVTPPGQIHARPMAGKWGTKEEAVSKALEVVNSERNTKAADAWRSENKGYRSSHWDQPNVLAHIRVNDRTDADGKRVLFVEEIQSDWGQDGKKKGFDTPEMKAKRAELRAEHEALQSEAFDLQRGKGYSDLTAEESKRLGVIRARILQINDEIPTKGIAPAPFVDKTDKWLALSIKRVIKMAVDGGYDRVAFVNGEQSAERYDLSKQISQIKYEKTDVGGYEIEAYSMDGGTRVIHEGDDEQGISIERVEELVGKDLAKKIANGDGEKDEGGYRDWRSLRGLDLQVGGEGMKTFYNKIVPSALKDVLKKVGGGKIEPIGIADTKEGWHITDPSQTVRGKWMLKSSDYNSKGEFFDTESEAKAALALKAPALQQPGFNITDAMREKVAGGLPLFQRQQTAKRGMNKTDVQQAIAGVTGKWSNGPKVNVVATTKELPMAAPSDVHGVYFNGSVYLVAANIGDKAAALKVLAHEAIAHHGLRDLLGKDDWKKLMDNITLAVKTGNKPLNAIKDEVRKAYLDDAGQFNLTPGQESDEIAAKVVEQAIDADGNFRPGFGFVKAVYAKIADFLRSLGFTVKFTHAELQGLLVNAQRNLEVGKRTEGARGRTEPVFSRIDQTETEAFKKWFGDSKVVDAQGKPLVVYHGTQAKFTSFDRKKSSSGMFGTGFYFTTELNLAEEYAEGGPVMEVYLSLKNPAPENVANEVVDRIGEDDADGIRSELERLGYDGVLMNEYGNTLAVAFNPKQIKSATGNNGNFDPNDPDIRFSRSATATQRAPVSIASTIASAAQPQLPNVTQPQAAPVPLPEETKARAAQRRVQDQFNRFTVIRNWAQENGMNLSQLSNVWGFEERMHGRIATRLEDFREDRVKPLVQKIQKAGFTMADAAEFLHAQHAIERNRQILSIDPNNPSGSGMTDADARAILAQADPKLKTLANEFRAITDDTRQTLLDAGIITPEMAKAWTDTYKHYVPLKGGDEDTQPTGTGKGLSVKATNKRAMGHGERSEFIIENIMRDHERAVMLAEKNLVGHSLLAMAIELGRDDIATVGQPERRKVLKNATNYEVIAKNGSVVGTFETQQGANSFIVTQTRPGLTVRPVKGDPMVSYSASPMLAENEVQVYARGHTIRIQLNDPLIARAYKKMGVEQLTAMMRINQEVNTFLSKAYTGYNPEFFSRNVLRDFTSGLINITGQEGAVFAAKAAARYPKAFAQMLRYSYTGKASPSIKLYREHGGSTGAAYLGDIERIGADIQNAYEEYQGAVQLAADGRPLTSAKVAGKKLVKMLVSFMEHLNAAGENSMRLAVFDTMRAEPGRNIQEAASLAKNATVNFNRKGEIGAQANALYLFFNAAMQGSAATLDAMFNSKHKHQAQAIAGMLGLLAYSMAAMQFGGDDDEDKNAWEKVPDYVKDRNLVIRTGKDTYITLSIPYGYGFFFTIGNSIFDLQRGGDKEKIALKLTSGLLEHFGPAINPLGGDELDSKGLVELVPGAFGGEMMRNTVRLAANRSGFGNQIVPDSAFDEGKPDSQRMFRTSKGTPYEKSALLLNQISGGTKSQAGSIDVSPESVKFWVETITGGTGKFVVDTATAGTLLAASLSEDDPDMADALMPEIRELPIVRTLVRKQDIRDARQAYWDTARKVLDAQADFKRAKSMEDLDGMEGVVDEASYLLNLAKIVEESNKAIKARRDFIDKVNATEEYTRGEKRLLTKQIEQQENAIYESMIDIFEGAKKSKP